LSEESRLPSLPELERKLNRSHAGPVSSNRTAVPETWFSGNFTTNRFRDQGQDFQFTGCVSRYSS
jgi:hypothetical protein